MSSRLRAFALTTLVGAVPLALAACAEPPMKYAAYDATGKNVVIVEAKGPLMLGGVTHSLHKLEHGREVYMHYCRACHGDNGDGRGASSIGLRPPPRDFRAGLFKFGSTSSGLPTDDDFRRIIRYGLKGTAMLPWDLSNEDMEAVIQFIKTFSPRWQPQKFKAVDPIKPPADTWMVAMNGQAPKGEAAAIERGKFVYHQKAQCGSCHPNFATYSELSAFAKADGQELTAVRDDAYGSLLKESQYKIGAELDGKGGQFLKILPPDFTRHEVRSVRIGYYDYNKQAQGSAAEWKTTALSDLYRVIAGGIAGTPMPTWKGVFPDEDIWAMAHYVYSLIVIKETPAAVELHKKFAAQPKFEPPPPPAEPPPPPPETTPAPAASGSAAASASASAAPSAKPPAPKK